jgi:hypothetical protein
MVMQAARFVTIGMLTSALCACAGTGGARPTAQLPDDYDATKVAVVTQWAKTKGATVIWINYPTVPRPRDGG